jgi:hypothetical protein
LLVFDRLSNTSLNAEHQVTTDAVITSDLRFCVCL